MLTIINMATIGTMRMYLTNLTM